MMSGFRVLHAFRKIGLSRTDEYTTGVIQDTRYFSATS